MAYATHVTFQKR